MVMQSGEDPAGGKDSKSAKPLPWKYIALAAIVAAAILGIFFATTAGIFSDPVADTTTTTTSTFGSGFSPPAETNSGSLAVTDKEDEKSTKTTATAKISEKPIWDLDNLPKEIPYKDKGIYITNFKIGNGKISGTIENRRSSAYPLNNFYFKICREDGKVPNISGSSWLIVETSTMQWTGGLQTKDRFGFVLGVLMQQNEKVHFETRFPEHIEKRMIKDHGIHYVEFGGQQSI